MSLKPVFRLACGQNETFTPFEIVHPFGPMYTGRPTHMAAAISHHSLTRLHFSPELLLFIQKATTAPLLGLLAVARSPLESKYKVRPVRCAGRWAGRCLGIAALLGTVCVMCESSSSSHSAAEHPAASVTSDP